MAGARTRVDRAPDKTSEAPMLVVRELVRRFADLAVVDGLSFTVHAGQALALTGANGSGKTTVLRCLIGADTPDEGTVELAGRPLRESDPAARALVATALDDAEFFPDLSVGEQLELLARAHGNADPGEIVDSVLAELGLAAARDQLPVTLSSGQHRRLTLAACFVRPRRLLVLDEPEQRLDADGRLWLGDRLLREKAAGCAVLLASHEGGLLDKVADTRIEVRR